MINILEQKNIDLIKELLIQNVSKCNFKTAEDIIYKFIDPKKGTFGFKSQKDKPVYPCYPIYEFKKKQKKKKLPEDIEALQNEIYRYLNAKEEIPEKLFQEFQNKMKQFEDEPVEEEYVLDKKPKQYKMFKLMPYVAFNQSRYNMIVIDIDNINQKDFFRYDQLTAYTMEGLPIPNIIVTTKKGLHLIFFIKGYILPENKKSFKYFMYIYNQMIKMFDGDPNMNKQGICRNPFFNYKKRKEIVNTEQIGFIFHKYEYELDELNNYIQNFDFGYNTKTDKQLPIMKWINIEFKEEEWYEGNRNNYMFKHLIAYRTLHNINTEEELLEYARKINQKYKDQTPPLPDKELQYIVRSIIKYNRQINYIPKKCFTGITGLFNTYIGHVNHKYIKKNNRCKFLIFSKKIRNIKKYRYRYGEKSNKTF